MPFSNFDSSILSRNCLLMEELCYGRVAITEESVHLITKLMDEQKVVYDTMMGDTLTNGGGMFFVYRYG